MLDIIQFQFIKQLTKPVESVNGQNKALRAIVDSPPAFAYGQSRNDSLCEQKVLLNNRTLTTALPRLAEKSRKCWTQLEI